MGEENNNVMDVMPADNGEKSELATTGPESVVTMLNKAVEHGADVESLTRLVDLYERLEERNAKKAFTEALKRFQSKCPVIEKRTEGYNYKYADLADIKEQVQPILDECGLAYDTDTELKQGYLICTVTLMHIGGYEKQSTMSIPVEHANGSSMNIAQKHGSARSYGLRYAFCDALGIMTGDEDDDAASVGPRGDGGHNPGPPRDQAPPSKPEPKTPTEKQLKKLHATAVEYYGSSDIWDSKRPDIVESVTKGRTSSSSDLTRGECSRLIEGLEHKIEQAQQEQAKQEAEYPDDDVTDDEIPTEQEGD